MYFVQSLESYGLVSVLQDLAVATVVLGYIISVASGCALPMPIAYIAKKTIKIGSVKGNLSWQ